MVFVMIGGIMEDLYVKEEIDGLFYISTFVNRNDVDMATVLGIEYEKYIKILQNYGATFTFAGYSDNYFKTEEDAYKCIAYLNKGTYIEDTKCICEYVSCDMVSLSKNKLGLDNNRLYIYDGEYVITDIQIVYCPKCGKKLNQN